MINKDLKLKDVRLRTGLSISEFARRFGIEPNSYLRMEQSRNFTYYPILFDELCKIRGYYPAEEQQPHILSNNHDFNKTLLRLSSLDPDFYSAFNVDDYVTCLRILDEQHTLHRISDTEYKLVYDYINEYGY